MNEILLRIIVRACINRLQMGEDINTVVDSYTKLSTDEKTQLIAKLTEGGYVYGAIGK